MVEQDLVPRTDVVMSVMVMEVLDLAEGVIDGCTVRSCQSYQSVPDLQMVSIHLRDAQGLYCRGGRLVCKFRLLLVLVLVMSVNIMEKPAEHHAPVCGTCLTERAIQPEDHDQVDAHTSVLGPSLA